MKAFFTRIKMMYISLGGFEVGPNMYSRHVCHVARPAPHPTMLPLLVSTRTFLDIDMMSTNHLDQKSKNVAQKIWLEQPTLR